MASTRAEAKRAAERRTRLLYVAIAVLVVGVAVLIAVLSSGERGSAVTVEDLAGAPTISGDPLPPAPQDPASDPATGTPAPVVEGADFQGDAVTIGEPGAPQLIMFMASWCPACQEELPEVVEWVDGGGLPDGVELVSVSTGLDATRPNWPPTDWFEREGYTNQILVDDADGSVAQAYGLQATPYWVALDAEGQVVTRVSGLLGAEQLDTLAAAVRPAG